MRRTLIAVLFAFPLATGCGRAASESKAPPPAATEPAPGAPAAEESDAEPTTLEEAEAALSRAESELESAVGPLAFAAPPPAAAPAATEGAPPPSQRSMDGAPRDRPAEKSRAEAEAPSEASAAAPATKKEGPDCGLACRAYGSLNRAVEAVCRLDSGGERCARARRVAADAEARVSSCACPRP